MVCVLYSRYDCALINWYPDGECAVSLQPYLQFNVLTNTNILKQCKYHSDPDHGRLWSQDTVVVSVGETRRFNLREITNSRSVSDGSSEEYPHSFHVKHGDAFYMHGDCQDTYQHCVMKSEGSQNDGPRASIVFKKSLPQLNGRRGHGLNIKVISEKSREICYSRNNIDKKKLLVKKK